MRKTNEKGRRLLRTRSLSQGRLEFFPLDDETMIMPLTNLGPLRATGQCHGPGSCTRTPKGMKLLQAPSLLQVSTSCDALAKLSEVDVRTVMLNVYDLSQSCFVGAFNKAALVLVQGGIFHVAVEVFLREYSFGSTQLGSGVACIEPRRDTSHTYRGSVQLGQTELSARECRTVVKRLAVAEDWQGRQYNSLAHNCTHFARELVSVLGVAPVPDWVDRLGRVAEGTLVACWSGSRDTCKELWSDFSPPDMVSRTDI